MIAAAPADADTILAALRRLGEGTGETITLGEAVARLDARAHALVLFLLAAVNLTPGPSIPGFSTLFGIPLCVVAFEMAMGRRVLRLPRFLARREIRRVRLVNMATRLGPLLRRVEGWLSHRLPGLAGAGAERALGGACVGLGVLLALPIPVFSLAPAAALTAIALGLLLRDGVAVLVGLALGVASCAALLALGAIVIGALDAAG